MHVARQNRSRYLRILIMVPAVGWALYLLCFSSAQGPNGILDWWKLRGDLLDLRTRAAEIQERRLVLENELSRLTGTVSADLVEEEALARGWIAADDLLIVLPPDSGLPDVGVGR